MTRSAQQNQHQGAPPPDVGHRERKKWRTRQAIIDAALRLFEERGYQAATIADIAEAANISPATFFIYFPAKANVLFGQWAQAGESLDQRLTTRAPGEPALEALSLIHI